MAIIVVGKWLVDDETGEIVTPVYEVVKPFVSASDKRFYMATARSAHECIDPEQLKDVMVHTVDGRGLETKSDLCQLKKESDYRVRTYKEKPMMSNPQYKLLQQLVPCITYKNIILCSRAELCEALGTHDKHLARKLKTVSTWVKQHPARKGYIRLFVHPWVGYRGRVAGISSAFNCFYAKDNESHRVEQYQPFCGPVAPYNGPIASDFEPMESFEVDVYEDNSGSY